MPTARSDSVIYRGVRYSTNPPRGRPWQTAEEELLSLSEIPAPTPPRPRRRSLEPRAEYQARANRDNETYRIAQTRYRDIRERIRHLRQEIEGVSTPIGGVFTVSAEPEPEPCPVAIPLPCWPFDDYIIDPSGGDPVAEYDLFGELTDNRPDGGPATIISRSAQISPDGIYRYRLSRQWGPDAFIGQPLIASPSMCFIMLNPSTADGMVDDATIRRCMGFARRESCVRLEVVNLFAFRSTDPANLVRAADAVGPENGDALLNAVEDCEIVVCAWGDYGRHAMAAERAGEVVEMLSKCGRDIYCLGATKLGHPRHPLYVKKSQPLAKFITAAVI